MEFQLIFSEQAKEKLLELETDKSKKGLLKQLRKALGLMETNLKHPSLNTHKFDALQCKLAQVQCFALEKSMRSLIDSPLHLEFTELLCGP